MCKNNQKSLSIALKFVMTNFESGGASRGASMTIDCILIVQIYPEVCQQVMLDAYLPQNIFLSMTDSDFRYGESSAFSNIFGAMYARKHVTASFFILHFSEYPLFFKR